MHDEQDRTRNDSRDAAGDTPLTYDRTARGLDTVSQGALAHLSKLDDIEVADGAPDVRGWALRSAIGRDKLGEVTDLLVDTGSMQVRYLEVKLEEDAAARRARAAGDDDSRVDPTRYALVPIGLAHLDDENDDVLVEASALDLPGLPPYERGRLDREFERAVVDGYRARGRGAAAPTGGAAPSAQRTPPADGRDDFYDDTTFDGRRFLGRRGARADGDTYIRRREEQLEVGKRAVEAGAVRVRKTVESERVRETVPVQREEVTVERRPVSADASRADAAAGPGAATLGESEIRVPVMAEEVVTRKRVVPKEEIVIRKHAVTDQQTVEDTVRKERVEVDRDGAARP